MAALHDWIPVAVRSAGGTSAAPTTYAIVYLAPAVVVRGTGGRRAGGGGLGVDDVASDELCLGTRAVYCAVPRAVGATRGPISTWRR